MIEHWVLPIAALVRVVSGWLENSFEDGKITIPEWKKLAETVFRMASPYLALVFGVNVLPLQAAFMTVLFDVIIVKLAKLAKK